MNQGDREVYKAYVDLSRKYSKLQQVLTDIRFALRKENYDSRKYLDKFYQQCRNNEIDDLDWVNTDDDFHDFVNQQGIEYNRIWDLSSLKLTSKYIDLIASLTGEDDSQ